MLRVIFLIGIFFAMQSVQAKQVVRISTGEWLPYISESLNHKGLLAQITSEAFALKGYEVQFGFFPWARATELSKTGEWAGTIALAHLKERESYYLYSLPLYIGRYVFFHLKSQTFSWNKYEDLKNMTMASTRGFGGMGDEFLSAERGGVIKVLRLTSDVQSFNMLKAGRIQAVPSDLEVGYVSLRRMYGKDADVFTHSSHLIHQAAYHLVISKKEKNGQQMIEIFNEGLKELHRSGRYDAILKSWYEQAIYKEAVPASYLPAPKVVF